MRRSSRFGTPALVSTTATATFADREGGGLETRATALVTLRSELHRPLGTALETLRSVLHRPLGTALETLHSELHRLSGVVRVTGAAFAQLQSWPTGTSQSLHPADALAADEATVLQQSV